MCASNGLPFFFADEYGREYIANAAIQQHQLIIIPPQNGLAAYHNDYEEDLTVEDRRLAMQGLPLQQYDVFVLYAQESEDDTDFANNIIVSGLKERGLNVLIDKLLNLIRF